MQKTPILNFYKAKDFSSAMNITFGFLRQNFRGLSKSLLFFAAPLVLLGAVFYQEIMRRIIAVSASSGIPEANPAGVNDYFTSVNFFASVFAALVCMLVGGVFIVATTYAYIILYQDKQTSPPDIADVWRTTRSLFWKIFGTMFMYYMGLSLSTSVLMIPLFILIGLFSFISPFLSALVVFAFYVAIIVLCIHFALIFYIRCREGIGFFASLNRLNNLSRGKFWSTIWVGGTAGYIQLVLSVVLIVPWYVFLFISQMHTLSASPLDQPTFLHASIGTVLFMIYSLGSILLTAIPLTAFAVQYHHLVEDKEARDLMGRIATVGVAVQAPLANEEY